MVVLAPGVVDAAAVISADVPSVALGTGALLAGRAALRRPVWGLAAGALICSALLVKLLAAPFAIALLIVALVERPSRAALLWFAVGALAVLTATGIVYASVLDDLWRDAVEMHLQARHAAVQLPHPSIAAQVALIVTAYVGIISILSVGLLHVRRDELLGWARRRLDLLATLAAALLLIAVNRPLLHHHLVILAWPLALLAASTLPARLPPRALAAVAVGGLLLVPWAVRGRDTVEGSESQRIDAAAAIVRNQTEPGETVVSDLPLVPLEAGRAAAAATVDPSAVRIGTGSLDRAQIVAAADGAGATVVGRSFADIPGLERDLATRYERVVEFDGIRIYLR